MSSPRSGLGVVAALVMAVASPALATADGTLHAEPAGQPSAAVHLDPLPWNVPWSQGPGAEVSAALAPWEVAAPWLTPAYRSGLLIAIDPATRRLARPTPAQRRAFSDLLGPDEVTPDLPAERLSRGGEVVHLNGRFQIFSIARRDASGRLILDCVSDPTHAAKPVTGSRQAPLQAKER
ncbi:MAG TPA: hypothetical protein VFP58_14685 [Candidatus Eisenbacteria bacterium]|nr:hypothetical protein [Candidatus Eisenbacteria bacterium]